MFDIFKNNSVAAAGAENSPVPPGAAPFFYQRNSAVRGRPQDILPSVHGP